jgi:hypothetical protein
METVGQAVTVYYTTSVTVRKRGDSGDKITQRIESVALCLDLAPAVLNAASDRSHYVSIFVPSCCILIH